MLEAWSTTYGSGKCLFIVEVSTVTTFSQVIGSVGFIKCICSYIALNLSNHHNLALLEAAALVRVLRAWLSAYFLPQGRTH